jgi:hypothetical protein
MGNSAGGGTRRALRRWGPVVAIAAGATVVAASVMGRRRRPSGQPGLAGPVPSAGPGSVPDPGAASGTGSVPGRGAALGPGSAAGPGPDPAAGLSAARAMSAPGVAASAGAGAPAAGERPATPGGATDRPKEGRPSDAPSPLAPDDTITTGPSTRHSRARAGLRSGRRSRAGLGSGRRSRAGLGSGRRSRALLGAVVGVALVAAIGVAVASAGGGDRPDAATTATETPGRPGDEGGAGSGTGGDDVVSTSEADVTTTQAAPVSAATAFATAADRLTAAGTFSYSGTVSATDVSHVRPMLWLSVESTVEGQVSLPDGRLHETATTTDGRVAETVAAGRQVWGRQADGGDGLAAVPYVTVPALSGAEPSARGAVLLPTWLAAAVGPADAPADESGRRRVSATIPAAALGRIERERPPVDATVVLTLDAAGAPVRVEITSAPGGPALRLAYDLAGLGTPVDIQTPA